MPGFLAGLTPRSSGVVPRAGLPTVGGERGSRLVWRGLPAAGYCRVVASDIRHDDAQTPAMPVAAFRLTGSVSGFHDPSLVSVMVHVTPDAPNRPRPPWRGNACVGPHGRGPRTDDTSVV